MAGVFFCFGQRFGQRSGQGYFILFWAVQKAIFIGLMKLFTFHGYEET